MSGTDPITQAIERAANYCNKEIDEGNGGRLINNFLDWLCEFLGHGNIVFDHEKKNRHCTDCGKQVSHDDRNLKLPEGEGKK